jgi:hypothetical protein
VGARAPDSYHVGFVKSVAADFQIWRFRSSTRLQVRLAGMGFNFHETGSVETVWDVKIGLSSEESGFAGETGVLTPHTVSTPAAADGYFVAVP